MKQQISAPVETAFHQLIKLTLMVEACFREALLIVLRANYPETPLSDELAEKLYKHFYDRLSIYKIRNSGLNRHLADDFFPKKKFGSGDIHPLPDELPRVVRILLLKISEANDLNQQNPIALPKRTSRFLPSPLHLAIEALVVPSEPQSRAYLLIAGKSILAERFSVWPRNSFSLITDDPGKETIDEADIVDTCRYFNTFVTHRDNLEVNVKESSSGSTRKRAFIAYYLAATGVLHLRGSAEELDLALENKGSASDSQTTSSSRSHTSPVEFRLSKHFARFPPASNFVNQILGVPVALRGFDTIFFEGLKASAENGLVIQITGGPGAGKTTFALALASALSPVGTQTLYFSFEESPSDLLVKLRQQSQPNLRHLSFCDTKPSEFFSTAIGETHNDLASFGETQLRDLASKLDQMRGQPDKINPPIPAFVVIDSLSAMKIFSQPGDSDETPRRVLAKFVNTCRELKALVLLTSGELINDLHDLDYLVDMALSVSILDGDQHSKKPARIFTVKKSRHQVTRHGSHLFHLAGEAGFRFSPQLPSQMDAQHNLKRYLWDSSRYISALNVLSAESKTATCLVSPYLNVHDRSQILIHGLGSGGKAGLALKIALSPRFLNKERQSQKNRTDAIAPLDLSQSSPNVLVVSFLYPRAYYEEVARRIKQSLELELTAGASFGDFDKKRQLAWTKRFKLGCSVEVLQLTPGVLQPEDLHSKLTRAIATARFKGRPFTTIIIDGLHNLALQFPESESPLLLPIIYATLNRSGAASITTFTTLALSSTYIDGHGGDTDEEFVFRLKSHMPLLHTLVQGSDYVFEVVPVGGSYRSDENDTGASYLIKTKSAISVDPPKTVLGWDRQKLVFVNARWDSKNSLGHAVCQELPATQADRKNTGHSDTQKTDNLKSPRRRKLPSNI
jgi:KaiC/GvpD/RAD55 family RecA-like ATPase